MARYDFECPKCRRVIEISRPMSDETVPLCCEPGCDGQVEMIQLIGKSNFHLKGLGWSAEGYSKTGVD